MMRVILAVLTFVVWELPSLAYVEMRVHKDVTVLYWVVQDQFSEEEWVCRGHRTDDGLLIEDELRALAPEPFWRAPIAKSILAGFLDQVRDAEPYGDGSWKDRLAIIDDQFELFGERDASRSSLALCKRALFDQQILADGPRLPLRASRVVIQWDEGQVTEGRWFPLAGPRRRSARLIVQQGAEVITGMPIVVVRGYGVSWLVADEVDRDVHIGYWSGKTLREILGSYYGASVSVVPGIGAGFEKAFNRHGVMLRNWSFRRGAMVGLRFGLWIVLDDALISSKDPVLDRRLQHIIGTEK